MDCVSTTGQMHAWIQRPLTLYCDFTVLIIQYTAGGNEILFLITFYNEGTYIVNCTRDIMEMARGQQ